jgi:CubicO group peptidase (beta-lactamase class C family)
MTKAITSMATLMLWEEEKLDLDDPLSKFFPPLKKMKVWKDGNLIDTEREATVADLLRHTSGLTYGWMSSKPIREALRSAGVLDRNKKLVPMMNGMARCPCSFSRDRTGYTVAPRMYWGSGGGGIRDAFR